jgi:hypothetical protein
MDVSLRAGRGGSATVATLIAVLVAGLACLAIAAQTASAAATASKNGCTVRPHNPYTFFSGGVRYASASVYVTCSTSRSGLTRARIMESDPGFDDTVVGWQQQAMFTIPAGQTAKVGQVTGACRNHDLTGAEELYAQAQINVGGVWSDVAQTLNVSATC